MPCGNRLLAGEVVGRALDSRERRRAEALEELLAGKEVLPSGHAVGLPVDRQLRDAGVDARRYPRKRAAELVVHQNRSNAGRGCTTRQAEGLEPGAWRE